MNVYLCICAFVSVCVCVRSPDYQEAAKERLPVANFEWISEGAADDHTLHANQSAWSAPGLELMPRGAVDVSSINLAVCRPRQDGSPNPNPNPDPNPRQSCRPSGPNFRGRSSWHPRHTKSWPTRTAKWPLREPPRVKIHVSSRVTP